MEKGKDIGADTGKFRESPESCASRLACELRRVDEAIDMLGRELVAAVTQREAVLGELGRYARENGLDPSDYYDGNINTASPSDE